MTRGKIVYVDKDGKIYSTVEFNGDMYPDGNALEILEMFELGFFTDYHDFELFVIRFNKKHYGYEEELIGLFSNIENNLIDVSENWTDYLYIINESEEDCVIKDKNRTTVLENRTMGIVRFQQVEKTIHRVLHENSKEFDETLSKEDFVDIMTRLRDSSDLVDRVDDLFRNSRDSVECDFCNGASLQISHEGIVISLLGKILKDTGDDIGYFIYELDYGRKFEPGMITYQNGRDIDLGSAEKLYDYLVEKKNI